MTDKLTREQIDGALHALPENARYGSNVEQVALAALLTALALYDDLAEKDAEIERLRERGQRAVFLAEHAETLRRRLSRGSNPAGTTRSPRGAVVTDYRELPPALAIEQLAADLDAANQRIAELDNALANMTIRAETAEARDNAQEVLRARAALIAAEARVAEAERERDEAVAEKWATIDGLDRGGGDWIVERLKGAEARAAEAERQLDEVREKWDADSEELERAERRLGRVGAYLMHGEAEEADFMLIPEMAAARERVQQAEWRLAEAERIIATDVRDLEDASYKRGQDDAEAQATELREALADPEKIARLFHETYERLAPEFGYETRRESAVPWEQVPEQNRRLMVAVAAEVAQALAATQGSAILPATDPGTLVARALLSEPLTREQLEERKDALLRGAMPQSVQYESSVTYSVRALLENLDTALHYEAEVERLTRERDDYKHAAGAEPDEYSPAFQDEYQRLWHEAAAEATRLRGILVEIRDLSHGEREEPVCAICAAVNRGLLPKEEQ